MTLERPAMLAIGALALAVLLLLYLVVRRRVRVEVPALRLWREVERDLARSGGLGKLRRSLSLLLHALAVLFAAIALAAPSCNAPTERAARLVLVVDTTASMGARDGATTRLARARDAVLAQVRARGANTELVLIASGCDPGVLVGVTRERGRVERALAGLSPSDCAGDLSRAVALAAERARGATGPVQIEVFTDGVTDAGPLPATTTANVFVRLVGPRAAPENVGIVAADLRAPAERDPADGEGRSLVLFVALERSGNTTAPTEVTLTATWLRPDRTESVAGVRALTLPAGRSTASLPVRLATRDTADLVRVTLTRDEPSRDALAADDAAYAPVPAPDVLDVRLVVTAPGASPFVRRALAADPLVRVRELTPAQLTTDTPAGTTLTVFSGTAPERAPDGDSLAFGPFTTERPLGFSLEASVTSPRPTDVHPSDARARYLTLDDVHLAEVRPVRPSERVIALATSDRGTLIAARDDARSSATLVAFDPHRGDWPLRPSFVLFLRSAVEHARARTGALALRARRAGASVEIPAHSAPSRLLRTPDGVTLTLPVRDGVALATRTERAGLYTVAPVAGFPAERFALALLSPDETRLLHREIPYVNARSAPLDTGAPARAPRPLAPYVLAFALLALCAEALWYAGAFRPRPRGAR